MFATAADCVTAVDGSSANAGFVLASATATSATTITSTTATTAGVVQEVFVCLAAGGGSSPHTAFHDTGLRVYVGKPSITVFPYDRVVKGDEVTYAMEGTFLYGTQKIKLSTAACSGTSDASDAVAGGDGTIGTLSSASTAIAWKGSTSGASFRQTVTVTFTLSAATASAANVCFFTEAAGTHGGTGAYAAADTSPTVTVLDMTSIAGGGVTLTDAASEQHYVPDLVATTYTVGGTAAPGPFVPPPA